MTPYQDVGEFLRVAQSDFALAEPTAPEPGSSAGVLLGSAHDAGQRATLLRERAADAALPLRERAAILGAALMLEELGETMEAMARGDVVGTADGLADLQYVACWTAHAHGIPLDAVHQVVHGANMMKFPPCGSCHPAGSGFGPGPLGGDRPNRCDACGGTGRVALRDPSGKVTKPPGWAPPDVAGVLARHTDDARFRAEHDLHAAAARAAGFWGRE